MFRNSQTARTLGDQRISYVGRDFMTAIKRRDHHAFVDEAVFYTLIFAASTLAVVIYRFTKERLSLFWREWFTARLAGIYLDDHFYYQLTVSLARVSLNGTFTVIAFSGVLWSISRALFAVAVGDAILGSTMAYLIGRPLVRLNYDQSDREAGSESPLRARLLAGCWCASCRSRSRPAPACSSPFPITRWRPAASQCDSPQGHGGRTLAERPGDARRRRPSRQIRALTLSA